MRSPGHLPNASVMLYESIVLRARELTCKQLKVWNPWSRTGSNKTCALPNSIRWFHISKSTHSTNNCGKIKYVKCMVWCSLSKFQKGGSLLKFDSFFVVSTFIVWMHACMQHLPSELPIWAKQSQHLQLCEPWGKTRYFFLSWPNCIVNHSLIRNMYAAVQCSLKAALPITLRAGLDDPLEHVVQAGIQGLPASYLERKTMGRWPFHKL